ncbi:unnamed protein product [Lymnaea stagnalis]|uniref:Uncharacterized protein n=1 Tax=Lymnaea stagnalis TaxID=6523 RepID=A0AAV2HYT0_LYMST
MAGPLSFRDLNVQLRIGEYSLNQNYQEPVEFGIYDDVEIDLSTRQLNLAPTSHGTPIPVTMARPDTESLQGNSYFNVPIGVNGVSHVRVKMEWSLRIMEVITQNHSGSAPRLS